MKAQSEATIQFSGYPLSIVVKKPAFKSELTVVRSTHNHRTVEDKNVIANDPKYWDVDWFNGYE